MGATIRTAIFVICLFAPGAILAQDSRPAAAPTATVRVTAVKATGEKGDGKPAIPPELESQRETLVKLSYDRYQRLDAPEAKGPAGAALELTLPESHSARVVWSDHEGPDGDLQLDVVVEKPAEEPEEGKQKVAAMKVRLKPGATFLIKCPKVYSDGDLLLLVTAARNPSGE